MRKLGSLVLGGVALVALAMTNPPMEAFEAFAADHLEAQLQARAGNSALGRLLAGAGAGLARQHLGRVTTRKNYLVASTYTVDLDGRAGGDMEWRFLGVGGRFIPLQTPEQGSGRQAP